MHVVNALITMALAMASMVAATPGPAAATNTDSVASATLSSTPAAITFNAQPISVAGQHSVFGYMKFTGNTANSAYSVSASFNGSVPLVATNVPSGSSNVVTGYQVGQLFCPVCITPANITLTAGTYTYNYLYAPVNATGSSPQVVTGNATTITDTNVQLVNATGLPLNTPTPDNENEQPGKLLYFTVPSNTGTTGNATSATLLFTSTQGVIPFTDVYVVGGGLCPVPSATDGVVRQHTSLSTFTTNLAGTVTIPNLTVGTFWVYLAPSATVKNTLTSASTATITVAPFGSTNCFAGVNGFCIVPAAHQTQSKASATLSSTAAAITFTPQPISVAGAHSVFGYMKFLGNTASSTYTVNANFNGSFPATGTIVPAASSNVAAGFQVGTLFCPVCLPAANYSVSSDTFAYNYIYSPVNATGSSPQVVTGNATTITDTQVTLVNATALPLNVPTTDSVDTVQPGKLLTFTVAANSSAAGNTTNGTIVFTSTEGVIPFTGAYIVGGGLCPQPNATDGVTRQVTSFSSWTNNLAGNVTIANLTTGTYWVYLAPSATVKNSLSSASTATLYYELYGNTTCTAGSNGFCSSAATLKSAVGVAFAGVMAAAFFLF